MVLADRRDYLPFTPDGKDPPRARAPAVPASQTIRGATAAAPLRARSSAAAIILCSDRQAHSRFEARLWPIRAANRVPTRPPPHSGQAPGWENERERL